MIVMNNGNYIRHFGTARLIPGTNKLNDEDVESFKEALKNKLNKRLTVLKEIDFIEDKKITELSADEAQKLIKDTYSVALLEQFLSDEEKMLTKKRTTVVKAIQEQINAIEKPSEDEIVDRNG